MNVFLFASLLLVTSFARAWPTIVQRTPTLGGPPPELLRYLEATDDSTGSNSRRSIGPQIGGYHDLPEELRHTFSTLDKRDHRQNCGPNRDGNVMTWVPVETWITTAATFCNEAAGPDTVIPVERDSCSDDNNPECHQGWFWKSYDVTLTAQDERSQGDPGHVNFFIRNTKRSPAGGLSFEDCMLYQRKQSNGPDVGASRCWGSKNNDTRGGAWSVDSFGQVGGYIYSGHVTQAF
ncbi:uncharacterized protein Z518_01763 [Rhinocladiella mackenziei CBS 650.93]|uniref:Rhinocladiella mackenziei CBS 650.93 unplaced genomic scaffold supercont1.1, whole genome shotgun sequence n=1 Tax=Rhinocladiella mackenziei CBS 650.93 TaxID=1442369 RepID=A0A0D2IXC7_9EURO|nr:uncharacterized protein Z518_01763 [Rhinocladiella mackenziei CBS 650.93]KIX10679.1 hypothetical protein Z518_01763 [Rhinocladiella mackenziei CBS 650.93]